MHRIRLRVQSQKGCPLYEPGDGLDIISPTVSGVGQAPVCMRAVVALGNTLRRIQHGERAATLERLHCGGCHDGEAWFAIRMEDLAFYPPLAPDVTKVAAEALGRTRLFAGLRPRVLERLARFLRIGGAAAGELVVARGRPVRAMGVVIHGRFEVRPAAAGAAGELAAGDCFGETLLISGEPSPCDVICRERAFFLEVRPEDLPLLAAQAPGLGVMLARMFARDAAPAKPATVGVGFCGRLETIHPAEAIQTIAHSRLTGTLVATNRDETFQLHCEEGRPVHAVLADRTGREAVFEFLKWSHGEFRFEAGRRAVPITIEMEPVLLLLEGLRMQDERAAARSTDEARAG